MPTIHLLVKGKVQGVFYRVSAKEAADELKVTGWVKNTTNGNVEVVATGAEDRLEAFIKWCEKGPRRASVSEVVVTKQSETFFQDFTVIREF